MASNPWRDESRGLRIAVYWLAWGILEVVLHLQPAVIEIDMDEVRSSEHRYVIGCRLGFDDDNERSQRHLRPMPRRSDGPGGDRALLDTAGPGAERDPNRSSPLHAELIANPCDPSTALVAVQLCGGAEASLAIWSDSSDDAAVEWTPRLELADDGTTLHLYERPLPVTGATTVSIDYRRGQGPVHETRQVLELDAAPSPWMQAVAHSCGARLPPVHPCDAM